MGPDLLGFPFSSISLKFLPSRIKFKDSIFSTPPSWFTVSPVVFVGVIAESSESLSPEPFG